MEPCGGHESHGTYFRQVRPKTAQPRNGSGSQETGCPARSRWQLAAEPDARRPLSLWCACVALALSGRWPLPPGTQTNGSGSDRFPPRRACSTTRLRAARRSSTATTFRPIPFTPNQLSAHARAALPDGLIFPRTTPDLSAHHDAALCCTIEMVNSRHSGAIQAPDARQGTFKNSIASCVPLMRVRFLACDCVLLFIPLMKQGMRSAHRQFSDRDIS